MTRRLVVFGPALIVLSTGLLSLTALRHALDTRDLVIHTRDVLDASSSLFTSMLEAESAQRGFIISRDTLSLGAYDAAAQRSESMLGRLRALTADNADQQARLDSLAMAVRARLALTDSSMLLARHGDFTGAASAVARRPGQRLVMDSRRLVLAVQRAEEMLLAKREADEQRAAAITSLMIAAGTIIAAVLAFAVNRGFDRALDERRAATDEVEGANELLKAQASELEARAAAARSAALEAAQATSRAQVAQLAAEESERRAERLQEATEAFGGALSLSEVASLIVRQAVFALNADSGVLASATPSGDALQIVAAQNVSVVTVGQTIPLGEEFPMCAAARTGAPVLLSNADAISSRFPKIVSEHHPDGVQAIAALPMQNAGHMLGALLVRWKTPRTLAPLDVSFMLALTRIAAEAIERARWFEAERDARAAAEAANRAKAAFLASMSHELRTPLQAALGFAQLVRSGMYGPVNDRQADALSRVERSQTHLARLIDDILDFARLEAGRVRVDLEPIRVADAIGELAPLVEPQASAKHLRLSLETPSSGLRVIADKQRLHQVLVNLVGNAIKFTPERGAIRVSAECEQERVAIRVSDTGTGIPEDRLNMIFEPFEQVDSALTRTQSGAGLGLAISRDLARAMGGDLSVSSEVGRGSTFSILLPEAGE